MGLPTTGSRNFGTRRAAWYGHRAFLKRTRVPHRSSMRFAMISVAAFTNFRTMT